MDLSVILAGAISVIALALAIALRNRLHALASLGAQLTGERSARATAESAAKERKQTLEERSAELNEAKEKLKELKRKLHDEQNPGKRSRELDEAKALLEREAEKRVVGAREEAERARDGLKQAQSEIETLRSKVRELDGRKRPVPKELSPEQLEAQKNEEKARIAELEVQLSKEKHKLEEAMLELKRSRARVETNNRVYLVAKSEAELARDRFSTLESKHNALLLERDVLRRAIASLEAKLGLPPSVPQEPEAPKAAETPPPPNVPASTEQN